MNKLAITLTAATLIIGPSLSWGADPASTSPSAAPQASGSSMGTSQAAAAPSENWTSLKGTVQAVDPAAKTVQLKDDSTGNLVQVPVDPQVNIQKNGQPISLSQVQTGDSIVLAKRNVSSQEQEKSKAY
jgi:hypothetical protein